MSSLPSSFFCNGQRSVVSDSQNGFPFEQLSWYILHVGDFCVFRWIYGIWVAIIFSPQMFKFPSVIKFPTSAVEICVPRIPSSMYRNSVVSHK